MDTKNKTKRMYRARAVLLAALVVAVVASGTVAGDSAVLEDLTERDDSIAAGGVDPSRVVIMFRDGIPADLPTYVVASGDVVMEDAVLGFVVVSVEAEQNGALLEAARADPRVESAELDTYVRAQYNPNDMLWNQQWGAWALDMQSAWDVTLGSHDVNLHILDTGIDHTHLDLADNLSPSCQDSTALGWSAVGVGRPGGQESGFHGTHVAGIAGAVIGNRLGVAGASQSCLTSVQVLATCAPEVPCGLATWVAAGIRWSADNGAEIISMSLGSSAPAGVIQSAVRYADAKGVLIVAASGNDGCAPVGYPAAYPEVMAVAALQTAGIRASYSNCGPQNEISAPGSGIWSTLPGNTYGPLDGTSMATPLVSGIAGLVWAVNSTLTHTEVRCILTATAVDLGSSGHDNQFGWGRIDPVSAVAVAQDPVSAAKDPSILDTSKGECPSDAFQEDMPGALFDPGHAYVDVQNNGLFDADVDTVIPSETVKNGSYTVANMSHGLVIPPSVGPIAVGNVSFRSGSQGHMIIRVDVAAADSAWLEGGRLDADGITAIAGGKLDLRSDGELRASGSDLRAGTVHAEASTIRLDDAVLTSTKGRVFVNGHDVHAPDATVQGQDIVRVHAAGDLDLAGATLSSTDGKVWLDAAGTVAL